MCLKATKLCYTSQLRILFFFFSNCDCAWIFFSLLNICPHFGIGSIAEKEDSEIELQQDPRTPWLLRERTLFLCISVSLTEKYEIWPVNHKSLLSSCDWGLIFKFGSTSLWIIWAADEITEFLFLDWQISHLAGGFWLTCFPSCLGPCFAKLQSLLTRTSCIWKGRYYCLPFIDDEEESWEGGTGWRSQFSRHWEVATWPCREPVAPLSYFFSSLHLSLLEFCLFLPGKWELFHNPSLTLAQSLLNPAARWCRKTVGLCSSLAKSPLRSPLPLSAHPLLVQATSTPLTSIPVMCSHSFLHCKPFHWSMGLHCPPGICRVLPHLCRPPLFYHGVQSFPTPV